MIYDDFAAAAAAAVGVGHGIARVAFCDGLFAMDGLPQTPLFVHLCICSPTYAASAARGKHESSYGAGHQPKASL